MADNQAKTILEGALALVDALNVDKAQLEKCTIARNRSENALDSLRKNIEQEKTKTVQSRRADLEKGFNNKIKNIEDEIKKIEGRRAKARSEGMKSRVVTQTEGLKAEIKSLHEQLAVYCREKKLSSLCKSKLFFSLFSPSHVNDWFLITIISMLMIGGLYAGYEMHNFKVFLGALIIDVLLIAIYMFIYSGTKGKYSEDVRVCKQYMDAIRKDKEAIRNITKNIQKDKDDSVYDLGSYDAEILTKKQEQQEQEAQKANALYQFDSVTKQQLISEIDINYGERLNQLSLEKDQANAAFAEISQKVAAAQNELNVNYVQYIGSKNMTHDSIEKMIKLIDAGEAVTISDAVSKISG